MVKESKYKETLNRVKKVLKVFDFFGESFTFTYKNEDKHSTVLGGIICILFYLIALIYFIYKFIPFCKNENFSLQYYTINLATAEKLVLKKDAIAFAFGITVNDNKNKSETNFLFNNLNISFNFVNKTKGYNKGFEFVNHTKCKTENFLNNLDKSFSEANINNFECVDLKNLSRLSYIPKGIYTDEEFYYYEISVKLKDNSSYDINKTIYNFLMKNDCKLQYYYTDITLDLSEHSKPKKTFINSMFLQLNPTLFQKKNIFYMNYHLYDDDSLIHFGKDGNNSRTFVGFSRVEDYGLYKGEDRTTIKSSDYAKIYIRADNKKVEIQRRYEDLMEFYADTSALLLSIFWILGVILAYYDRMMTNHEISKSLFYFKGTKEKKLEKDMEKNMGIKFNDLKLIKDLIESKEKIEIERIKKEKLEKKRLDKEKQEKENQEKENPQDDNKIIPFELSSAESSNRNTNDKIKINNFNRRESKSELIYETEEKNEEIEKIEKIEKIKKKGITNNLIDYSSYNIFEIIGSLKIFFSKSKKFKKKLNLIEQANNLINDKLDVKFYIRNMILFELINQIYLENKTILNFMSKPIIYYKKNIKEINEDKKDNKSKKNLNDKKTNTSLDLGDELDEKKIDEKKDIDIMQYFEGGLHEKAYQLNTNILSEKITNLILHPNKTFTQKKLIYCLKNHLKGI